MTVQDVIKRLEDGGWHRTEIDDHSRYFTHDTKTGLVTLSGQLDLAVPPAVLRSLLRHAQIEEGD